MTSFFAVLIMKVKYLCGKNQFLPKAICFNNEPAFAAQKYEVDYG